MNDDRKRFKMPGTPAGTGNGTTEEIIVANWMQKTFQFGEASAGALTATVTVQGRLDASMPWETIETFTAPTMTMYEEAFYSMRLIITGYSAGVLVAAVAGFNVQQ